MSALACSCGRPKDRRAKRCSECYRPRWDEAQEAILHEMLSAGATYKQIGAKLGRSEVAVLWHARLKGWRHDPDVAAANKAAGRAAFWADKARVRDWKRKVLRALRTPEARTIYSEELRLRNLAGKMGVRHHSDATKERIRAAHLGRTVSAETREKMSRARKRYWVRWRMQRGVHVRIPRDPSAPRHLPAFYGQQVSMTFPQARRNECTVGDYVVKLSPRLARILEILLMRGPRSLTSYTDLLEMIWPNPDDEPENGIGVLKVQVSMLRKSGIAVETTWGRGIRIAEQPRNLALAA